jgi:hypothetical protein
MLSGSACWEPNGAPINFRQSAARGSTSGRTSPPDGSYRRRDGASQMIVWIGATTADPDVGQTWAQAGV